MLLAPQAWQLGFAAVASGQTPTAYPDAIPDSAYVVVKDGHLSLNGSYGQILWMSGSGGEGFDSVDEGDAGDHVGDPFVAIEASPSALG